MLPFKCWRGAPSGALLAAASSESCSPCWCCLWKCHPPTHLGPLAPPGPRGSIWHLHWLSPIGQPPQKALNAPIFPSLLSTKRSKSGVFSLLSFKDFHWSGFPHRCPPVFAGWDRSPQNREFLLSVSDGCREPASGSDPRLEESPGVTYALPAFNEDFMVRRRRRRPLPQPSSWAEGSPWRRVSGHLHLKKPGDTKIRED